MAFALASSAFISSYDCGIAAETAEAAEDSLAGLWVEALTPPSDRAFEGSSSSFTAGPLAFVVAGIERRLVSGVNVSSGEGDRALV